MEPEVPEPEFVREAEGQPVEEPFENTNENQGGDVNVGHQNAAGNPNNEDINVGNDEENNNNDDNGPTMNDLLDLHREIKDGIFDLVNVLCFQAIKLSTIIRHISTRENSDR